MEALGAADLYYREYGPGFPLLFLHGGWGYEVFPFDRAIAALAGRFRILIPDRSGYGRSPVGGPLEPDFHSSAAREMIGFLDSLRISKAALWGHSDGAVIAALLGLAAPERFPAIIFEAFHYARAKRGSTDFFRAMISEPDIVSGRAREALIRDHGERWRQVLEWNAAAWLAIGESGPSDLYDGKLSQLAVRALFIDGSADPRTEPGDPEAIRRALPHAEFRVIEGAGHSPHSEPGSAEECVRIAADFLRRCTLIG